MGKKKKTSKLIIINTQFAWNLRIPKSSERSQDQDLDIAISGDRLLCRGTARHSDQEIREISLMVLRRPDGAG